MDPRKRKLALIAGAVSLAAVIGAGVAVASGASDRDQQLTGTALDRATSAALEHVGGGTVIETEVGDDGATYGVEVRLEGGGTVEVNLDADFNVIGSEGDDDGPTDADGPGDD